MLILKLTIIKTNKSLTDISDVKKKHKIYYLNIFNWKYFITTADEKYNIKKI